MDGSAEKPWARLPSASEVLLHHKKIWTAQYWLTKVSVIQLLLPGRSSTAENSINWTEKLMFVLSAAPAYQIMLPIRGCFPKSLNLINWTDTMIFMLLWNTAACQCWNTELSNLPVSSPLQRILTHGRSELERQMFLRQFSERSRTDIREEGLKKPLSQLRKNKCLH